jgi:hypothetical protein
VLEKSGGLYSSWGLSEEYGFGDVDGRRPHMGNYFMEHFPHVLNEATATGRTWKEAATSKTQVTPG